MKTYKSLTVANIKGTGIERCEKIDFTDDGNRFTGWIYKGLAISQCYSKADGTFLSFRPDYAKDLENNNLSTFKFTAPWEFYHMEETYKLGDKYNGVHEFNIDELIADLDTFVEWMKDVEIRWNATEVDVEKCNEVVEKEVNEAKRKLAEFYKNFDWMNADQYILRDFREYYKRLTQICESANKNVTKEEIYKRLQRLETYGYAYVNSFGTKSDMRSNETKYNFYIEYLDRFVKDNSINK